MEVVRHILKRRDMAGTETDFMAAQPFFDPAFLLLKNKVEQLEFLVELGDYDAEVRKAVDALTYSDVEAVIPPIPGKLAPSPGAPAPVSADPQYGDFLIRDHLFDLSVDQALGGTAVVMRTKDELLQRFRQHLGVNEPDKQLVARLWPNHPGKLGAVPYEQLAEFCGSKASYAAATAIVKATRGLQLLEFASLTTDKAHLSRRGFTLADERFAGRLVLAPAQSLNTLAIFAHETAHELFLRHADTAAGADATVHDSKDANACIMGELSPAQHHFCGACVLRLRGWSTR